MSNKRCFGCMQLKENSPVCEHCGFNENVQNESHQLPMGTVLRQQYMVGKCLGQGGFGITYLGWDLHLDIPVAIKEYYPNSIVNRDTNQTHALTGVATNMMDLYVSTRQRFLREAKVLAKLRNIPNIVQVHNFFEENNTAYIVMEYVKGIDLRRYMNMRGGRLSVEETLAILRPVMEALARVHDCEIVHRDISPDNIMMMADGTAKLLDFGAVRNIESMDADQDLQHSTEAILKHGFAPMEQYQKRGALGPWTDEYAMCATVYYCLTGRVPPDAPQRMMEDVHPAWEKIPGLSSSQRMALEKGMSLRGKDRYPNVRELMAALYGQEPQPIAEPIRATKPVQPMEMTPPEPVEEAEVPAYTAPMMTAPVEHVELPVQKKKRGGLIAGLVAAAVLLVAGFVALGILPKPEVHEPPAEEAPVIATEAPETTAPVETTEATEPLPIWYDNVLMAQTAERNRVFGTELAGTQIKSITFRDSTAGAPDDAWDVSEAQDGSVLMWCENDIYFLKDLVIAADGGINAKNTVKMFCIYQSLESIDFGDAFHTDYAVDFTDMFYGCEKLKTLDLSCFQTGNVTNMRSMFQRCFNLTDVNISSWDVSNVTNMGAMFKFCHPLTELDISDWDVSKVEQYDLFMDDGDTINGQPWEEFFRNPPKAAAPAANVDSDAWRNNVLMKQSDNNNGYGNNQNTAFRTSIIRNCVKSITFLDTLKDAPEEYFWDVSENQDGSVIAWVYQDGIMYDMYIAAEGGINAKHCDFMFYAFINLERIDFGNAFHTDEATSMHVMFWNCGTLTDLDISSFNTGNVKDMSAMFENCRTLTKLDLNNWDTSKVKDMHSMFHNCYKLAELNVSGWDTSSATVTDYMFGSCHALASIDVSNWDVSNITDVNYMFRDCRGIKNLDLSGWQFSKIPSSKDFMDSGDTINGKPWEEFFR